MYGSKRIDWFKIFFYSIFTLIGIMMVVGIFSQVGGFDQHIADKNAREFMSSLGINGSVVCARVDSDGDGYVSCTINDNGKLIPIECAAMVTLNKGCRMQRAGLYQR
jgi:hypothetical protein